MKRLVSCRGRSMAPCVAVGGLLVMAVYMAESSADTAAQEAFIRAYLAQHYGSTGRDYHAQSLLNLSEWADERGVRKPCCAYQVYVAHLPGFDPADRGRYLSFIFSARSPEQVITIEQRARPVPLEWY